MTSPKQSALAQSESAHTLQWQLMDTAPKDREILVRRHNDVFHEHYVVWWTDDPIYPWCAEHTAYPTERLDEWIDIPRETTLPARAEGRPDSGGGRRG